MLERLGFATAVDIRKKKANEEEHEMPSKNKSSSRKQHEEDEGLWGGHGVASAPEASEVAQGKI